VLLEKKNFTNGRPKFLCWRRSERLFVRDRAGHDQQPENRDDTGREGQELFQVNLKGVLFDTGPIGKVPWMPETARLPCPPATIQKRISPSQRPLRREQRVAGVRPRGGAGERSIQGGQVAFSSRAL